MKEINPASFNAEFKKLIEFWNNKLFNAQSNLVLKELFIGGQMNNTAQLGSMYLSRIIYGFSAAYKIYKESEYLIHADAIFELLIKKYKNRNGGFYWARTSDDELVHDVENINLAQAFILYGLAEYASVKKDPAIDRVVTNQIEFVLEMLTDYTNGGFIDGFDQLWNATSNQNKSFGTHLHLLEAFTKWNNYMPSPKLRIIMESLIDIICDRFITVETLDCMHRMTLDWKPLPNEVWAGHNAECSWILCKSAKATGNKLLQKKCDDLAVKMMGNVNRLALDKLWGGFNNILEKGKPITTNKTWWPQAECVIALLNCYEITHDVMYFDRANDLSNYISSTFIDDTGEWYSEIFQNGEPVLEIPMVHFWKSLYHNVRYYVEVKKRLAI